MKDISRRGVFGLFSGLGGAALAAGVPVAEAALAPVEEKTFGWARMELLRRGLVSEVGQDVYECWFLALEVERYTAKTLTASVPVLFLKRWIAAHYMQQLLRAAQRADANLEEVFVVVRKPATT